MDVHTHSEHDTIALGEAIGHVLEDGAVIALRGTLGAGKTHFVQGIAKGMGIDGPVVSPTFTILNYYETIFLSSILISIASKRKQNWMI